MKAMIVSPPCTRCGRQWKGQKNFECVEFILQNGSQMTGCSDCIADFGKFIDNLKREPTVKEFAEFWKLEGDTE